MPPEPKNIIAIEPALESFIEQVELIILAAGKSQRFGSCKLLAKWQERSLIDYCLEAALSLPFASINLVTGAYHREISHYLNRHSIGRGLAPKLELRYCNDWQQGMGHSLAYAVSQLKQTRPVLVMLADQVLINSRDLIEILSHAQSKPEAIVCAQSQQALSPPCYFPVDLKAELKELKGDKGAKALLQKYQQRLCFLSLPNAGFDVDRVEDLNQLSS